MFALVLLVSSSISLYKKTLSKNTDVITFASVKVVISVRMELENTAVNNVMDRQTDDVDFTINVNPISPSLDFTEQIQNLSPNVTSVSLKQKLIFILFIVFVLLSIGEVTSVLLMFKDKYNKTSLAA